MNEQRDASSTPWTRFSVSSRRVSFAIATFSVVGSYVAWWLHTGSMADDGLEIATARITFHFSVSVLAGVAAASASLCPLGWLGLRGRQFDHRTLFLVVTLFSLLFTAAGLCINRVTESRTLSNEERKLLGTWERKKSKDVLGKGVLTFQADRSVRAIEWINSIASAGDYCWKLEDEAMYLGPIDEKPIIGFSTVMTGRTPVNSWRKVYIRLLTDHQLQVGGCVYTRKVAADVMTD